MQQDPLSPAELLEDGFTVELARFPDTPLGPGDRLLYTDPGTGQVLIARAPIQPR